MISHRSGIITMSLNPNTQAHTHNLCNTLLWTEAVLQGGLLFTQAVKINDVGWEQQHKHVIKRPAADR